MKQIYQARDEMEAHWLKGLLGREGIDAQVFGGALSRVVGEVPFTEAFPTLHVADEQEQAARDALERILSVPASDADPDARPWQCPDCSEWVDAHFGECWNCGYVREDDADPPA
ncbi:MAG: DUF2007 domain-containing protein [Phycisphaeraceae bacterium]